MHPPALQIKYGMVPSTLATEKYEKNVIAY